jgi:hypothetical protein
MKKVIEQLKRDLETEALEHGQGVTRLSEELRRAIKILTEVDAGDDAGNTILTRAQSDLILKDLGIAHVTEAPRNLATMRPSVTLHFTYNRDNLIIERGMFNLLIAGSNPALESELKNDMEIARNDKAAQDRAIGQVLEQQKDWIKNIGVGNFPHGAGETVKPPTGLRHRYIAVAERIHEIAEAVERYASLSVAIPVEWIKELDELSLIMRNCKPRGDAIEKDFLEEIANNLKENATL